MLAKLAFSVSPSTLLVRDSLGRHSHCTSPTVRAFAFAGDGIATNGTLRAICTFAVCGLASMLYRVTGGAQGDPIGDYIGQVWMICHFLDMMCLQGFGGTAVLANVLVALEHAATPLLVFPSAVIGRIVGFAGGSVSAFFTAILGWVPAALLELVPAPLTSQGRGLAGLAATGGARNASGVMNGKECLATDLASAGAAVIAVELAGRTDGKQVSTLAAFALFGECLSGTQCIPVYVFPASMIVWIDHIHAAWHRALGFWAWHIASLWDSISHILWGVKRLADMGLAPHLVTDNAAA